MSLSFAQQTTERAKTAMSRGWLNTNSREWPKRVLHLRHFIGNLFFLGHFLSFAMTWHASMELPAHLPVSLLNGKLTAPLVKVLNLNLILLWLLLANLIRLWSCFTICRFTLVLGRSFVERFKLGCKSAIHVATSNQAFAQHTSFSEHFQTVTKAFAYYKFIDFVIVSALAFSIRVIYSLIVLHADDLFWLLFNFKRRCWKQWVVLLLLLNQLAWKCHIDDWCEPLFDRGHKATELWGCLSWSRVDHLRLVI